VFDRLAHIDQLTGLANRRTLDRVLELEVARAGRQGAPLSVAILEIDASPTFRRPAGNVASDGALKRVAQTLAETVRLVDTIARYGNEQFVLVAPGPDGIVVSERLVAASPHCRRSMARRSPSRSGLQATRRTAALREELIAAAERAMLSARQAGGDRVVSIQAE